ncbi:transcriptional regulator [Halobacteriales archaeon QS_8_65_32]|nr:MAG: transcriptional regulator [Halobacteriales archaeon QS_8_65_32]
MVDSEQRDPAVILRELGLKEYEARCFTALTRVPQGTAKEVSDIADVPRTRVYDAVDQLQSYGLVDIQHSTPQRFRAIPVEEAVTLLRNQFDDRFDTLRDALTDLEPVGEEGLETGANVWSTTGEGAITNRAIGFVDSAEEEIVLVLDGGGEKVTSDRLLDRLRAATDRGVTVYIGALSTATHEEVGAAVPDGRVFESGLEWLQPQSDAEDERIGRLLLVDRNKLLLSSLGSHSSEESAIWSDSVGNGLTVIGRRLLAAGLDREREDLDIAENDAAETESATEPTGTKPTGTEPTRADTSGGTGGAEDPGEYEATDGTDGTERTGTGEE